MLTHMTAGAEDWWYVYTANDERFWSYSAAGPSISLWSLRDLDGKGLREYNALLSWNTARDYVYRDGKLLASSYPGEGVRHFSLDHLGTPRIISDSVGGFKYHIYFPYGEEFTNIDLDIERMKFTGHERDFANPSNAADDLDYMHARHYGPLIGRFLSVDQHQGRAGQPQSWNRYQYALDSPQRNSDPDGRDAVAFEISPGLFGRASEPGIPHAGVYATHQGESAILSFGGGSTDPRNNPGITFAQLVNTYLSQGRSVTIFPLHTNDAQDATMVSEIVRWNLTKSYNLAWRNCTDAVYEVLRRAGVFWAPPMPISYPTDLFGWLQGGASPIVTNPGGGISIDVVASPGVSLRPSVIQSQSASSWSIVGPRAARAIASSATTVWLDGIDVSSVRFP